MKSGALFSIVLAVLVSRTWSAEATVETPPGFEDSVVASGFEFPTSIVFPGDDRILVGDKGGRIRLIESGVVSPDPFITIAVAIEGDRGLLSMALERGFSGAGYLYVLHVPALYPRRFRLSRFFLNSLVVGPEEIVRDDLPSESGQHAGGGLAFSDDGTIFVGLGDGGVVPTRAQDPANLQGSIIRIRPDGTAPPDNPFVGVPGALPEVFAIGFRNPFRIAVDPAARRLFVNDVGRALFEEVNFVRPGQNHGWPIYEGYDSDPSMTDPILAYPHDSQSASVTGSAVYRGTSFPIDYEGSYFFSDYSQGFIDRIKVDVNGQVLMRETFATGLEWPVTLEAAPDGALYYSSYLLGEIHKIAYVGGSANRRPTVRVTVDTDAGIAPLDVVFDTAASSDPDGDPLTFRYRFSGGAEVDTLETTLFWTFYGRRVHFVDVTADDARGGAATTRLFIDADDLPPVPVLTAPADGSFYAAGDEIFFSGYADDAEDGRIPDANLSFRVIFHHETHTHPILGPVAGASSGSFFVPRTGEYSTDVAYEVILDATDSRGITRSESAFLRPRLTTFRVITSPGGLFVAIDGTPTATPIDVPTVVGMNWTLGGAGAQIGPGGTLLGLRRWTDLRRPNRTVTIGEDGLEFEAVFLPLWRF